MPTTIVESGPDHGERVVMGCAVVGPGVVEVDARLGGHRLDDVPIVLADPEMRPCDLMNVLYPWRKAHGCGPNHLLHRVSRLERMGSRGGG